MMRTVLAIALLLPFAMPAASAAPPCEAAQADAPAYAFQTGAEVEIWQESNSFPGLQRSACEDESGRMLPSDTPIVTVPFVEVPTDLCITVPVVLTRLCVF